jgi:beta-galactosidase
VHVAVHEDESAAPRVVFLMNPTMNDVVARVSLGRVTALVDVLGEGHVTRSGGALEVTVPSRQVRMMAAETS